MSGSLTPLCRTALGPRTQAPGCFQYGAGATIRANATVEDPNQPAAGIALVLVNGKKAYHSGTLGARNGIAIRYQ